MSDEKQELVPAEPAEAPIPTDIPPVEAVETPPAAMIDEVTPTPFPAEAEAPAIPAADEAAPPVPPEAPVPPIAPAAPEAPVSSPPVAIAGATEVSGDDKLLAALTWFTMVIFQLPILSIVLLLIEPNRNRPFQRYHAVTSIAFWCVAVLYEIVVGLAMGMLTLATLGLFAFCLICLWVVFFLPHIVALIYAFYALTGRTPEIPVISRLAREQKWI
ncbi:MAG: hypothetical protein MUC51_09025 [Anaerolineae bacterium]|nr:hypothetical protein [Anaerolineae bacterium]